MARQRKSSDDVYNARRRVKRLAERMERAGNNAVASVMKALVSNSYKGGNVTVDTLNRVYERATSPVAFVNGRPQASTQGVKVAQAQSGRASRPKKASDEVYNARRRLRRQADRLERDASKASGELADQMRSFARQLRKVSESGKKLDAKERKAELDRLQRIREQTQPIVYGQFSEVFRRNLILQQQLNAAGTKDADSSISERKKDVFWTAVKGLWTTGEDIPRNERYDKILQAFYLSPGTWNQDKFFEWLRSKGIDPATVSGDLSLVFEYVTTVLNDPQDYEQPEVTYEQIKQIVITAR